MIKATACHSVLLGLTLTLAPVVVAANDFDVITAPAMVAPLATKATLTEITQAGEQAIAVGDFGVIVRREAAGAWQQAAVPSSVYFTAVDFANAKHGWAVGHHGVIVHSSDGGATWQTQLDGFTLIDLQITAFEQRLIDLQQQLDSGELDDDTLMLVEEQLMSVEFLLDNARFAKEEGPTRPFLDVIALSEDIVIAVGAYGTAVRSTDGGASWQVLDAEINNPSEFHFNALATDGTALYLAGEQGLLFKSDDQGASFYEIEPPYSGSYFGLFVDTQRRLWAFGLRGNVFYSDDQGASFAQVRLSNRVNINAAADAYDGGVYLVGNAGMVAHIDATGVVQEINHPSGATLTDVLVMPDQSLTLVGQQGVLTMPAMAQK